MGVFIEADRFVAQASSFDYWWERQGRWVEPPNLRRGGESGVQVLQQSDPTQPLLYCKRQVVPFPGSLV